METLHDLVVNGKIQTGKVYQVLVKTKIDLFPMNSTSIAYSEFYVADVVKTNNDTIIFVDYITGEKPNKKWMSIDYFKKSEVIRIITLDTNDTLLDSKDCEKLILR